MYQTVRYKLLRLLDFGLGASNYQLLSVATILDLKVIKVVS